MTRSCYISRDGRHSYTLRLKKKVWDMTTFSTCMALFIRNVSSYNQDSLWSWFICLCYTICVILTVGLTFSLGVLFPVLMDSFHEDRERTGRSGRIIAIRIWAAETQWSDVEYVREIINFSLVSFTYNNNNLLFKIISLLCLVSVIPMSEEHVILPIHLSLRAMRIGNLPFQVLRGVWKTKTPKTPY